ncbi:MAG TPA: hypothetical protein VFQ09_08800, partial [Rubrobacter sp.]|nr:hypothetical protein [Rubrobacter sp.]
TRCALERGLNTAGVQTFHLTAAESDRETIERVLEVYADSCPVAASVKGSIEISSELDLTAA